MQYFDQTHTNNTSNMKNPSNNTNKIVTTHTHTQPAKCPCYRNTNSIKTKPTLHVPTRIANFHRFGCLDRHLQTIQRCNQHKFWCHSWFRPMHERRSNSCEPNDNVILAVYQMTIPSTVSLFHCVCDGLAYLCRPTHIF